MHSMVYGLAIVCLLAPTGLRAAEKTCQQQFPKPNQLEQRINCVDKRIE